MREAFAIANLQRVRRSAAVAVWMIALSACGGGSDTPTSLPSYWVPTDVKAADLDGDGRTDVVTVALRNNTPGPDQGYVRVYRQTRPGVFEFSQYIVGTYPWRVEIADIDGDGAPDLLVLDVESTASVPNYLRLMRQDPARRGVFLAPQAIAPGLGKSYDMAVIDANHDDAPDIVVAVSMGADGATLLTQDPKQRGTFLAPTRINAPGNPGAVGAGDIDGDGITDLAFYSWTAGGSVSASTGLFVLVHGQKAGGFGPPTALFPQVGVNPELVAITDTNADGRADVLIVLRQQSTDFGSKITAAVQTPSGGFVGVDSSLGNLRGRDGFVVADLNRDGMSDLGATGFFPEGSPTIVRAQTSLLFPIGGGAFGINTVYEMPMATDSIAAADIDGDGYTDIVLQGGDDNQAFVMLQSSLAPGAYFPPRAL